MISIDSATVYCANVMFARRMSRLKSLFGGKEKKRTSEDNTDAAMTISGPTNVTHNHHVGFDSTTGTFTGLPDSWKQWLKNANIR